MNATKSTTAPLDIIHLAHVADAITEITGNDDYDEIAEQAARLLDHVPSLDREAARYSAGTIEWEHFTVIVRAALEVPAEPKVHADAGAGFPLCGWTRDDETTSADAEAVTCRFCRDRATADLMVAEVSTLFAPF